MLKFFGAKRRRTEYCPNAWVDTRVRDTNINLSRKDIRYFISATLNRLEDSLKLAGRCDFVDESTLRRTLTNHLAWLEIRIVFGVICAAEKVRGKGDAMPARDILGWQIVVLPPRRAGVFNSIKIELKKKKAKV